MVWAVLTPLETTSMSSIKKIVLGCLYCKPGSKKKTALIDHIAQVYQLLSSKYPSGLHWILGGDFNELKDQKILEISGSLKQVVSEPTRFNPPAILDKIITSLHTYYQIPEIQPPLDSDPDKTGKPSDHRIVVMKPVSIMNNKSYRTTKEITYRPITDVGLHNMKKWFQNETLDENAHEVSVHVLASSMMDRLRAATDKFFPMKTRKISSDSQPFFSDKLASLKRRKQREYNRHRRSEKWHKLDTKYKEKLNTAKKQYYKKEIAKLKKADPHKWFYWLKRLISSDQAKQQEVNIDSINHLPNQEQAEVLAEEFSSISQEYEKLKTEDVKVPPFNHDDVPNISATTVKTFLTQISIHKATVKSDIPPKILKAFASELSEQPLSTNAYQKEPGLTYLNVRLLPLYQRYIHLKLLTT